MSLIKDTQLGIEEGEEGRKWNEMVRETEILKIQKYHVRVKKNYHVGKGFVSYGHRVKPKNGKPTDIVQQEETSPR